MKTSTANAAGKAFIVCLKAVIKVKLDEFFFRQVPKYK
jgi:hypothetical protein